MSHLEVLLPGFVTTIQDLGRPGFAHLGVSTSGAADSFAFRLGNLLVGNEENTPALEMTLVGGSFKFHSDNVFTLTGSDVQPELDGNPLPMWTSVLARGGQILRCGATRSGARSYLCVAGGTKSTSVLGSTSTHLMTGMGGHEGRSLKIGDRLELAVAAQPQSFRPRKLKQDVIAYWARKDKLRVTLGPQAEWFSEVELGRFLTSKYTVTEESNRMGLRLDGPPLQQSAAKEMLTEGVSLGAIQVPAGGKPIILFVEHQTTGGYPKIANVILADLHRVGQLQPRDEICFELVNVDLAWALLREVETFISKESLLPT